MSDRKLEGHRTTFHGMFGELADAPRIDGVEIP
jgi:hypothetical protein